MSVISTISFILGGVVLTLIVALPVILGFWWWHLRKVKKKIVAFMEEAARKLQGPIDTELQEMIDGC